MTVREMALWLEQFPADTEVEVIIIDRDGYSTEPFEPRFEDDGYDYYDFTKGNAPSSKFEGRTILTLGEES